MPTDYRSFFERSPALLCTAGFDGAFIEVNDAFARALGFEVDELLVHSITELVHPADRAATLQAMADVAGGADVCFDNRCRRRDGAFCWLSWSVRADAEHQLLYFSARDVTELRDHADVVDKLLAELERSNTDLAQFAYVASHDLSEPLRMVSSYVQLLAARYSGQLDADADEFIAFAVDGAARMKALIDDLLAYSRAGGSVVLRRRVDCGVLVRGALADLDRVVAESGAQVVVDDLPVVDGDPGQLALVFQNLLA
ncbi:MAG: PAS domain S-box protein, partial [Acidimicrobiales bacterium]